MIQNKLKIYLDTTIPNYIFNNHTPEKQKASKQLFKEIQNGKFQLYISDALLRELIQAPTTRRDKIMKLISNGIHLEINELCQRLTDEYIRAGLIPPKNEFDALHIAIASAHRIDAIVSYNFEHIVRLKTIEGVEIINKKYNLLAPKIIVPEEIISYE